MKRIRIIFNKNNRIFNNNISVSTGKVNPDTINADSPLRRDHGSQDSLGINLKPITTEGQQDFPARALPPPDSDP